MKISIEVGHPSHIYYWKNVIRLLRQRGHDIQLFAREKEIVLHILRASGFDFQVVGSSKPTLLWKVVDLPFEDFRVLRLARKKGIEFMLSTGIPSSAHASRILNVPHVSLIDTEIAKYGRLLVEPFSDAICTPACFTARVDPSKHIPFNGYLELMYLHPKYFSPDSSVLELIGLRRGDPFIIVRFSSWDSSHDVGKLKGVIASDADRYQLVKHLSEKYQVFLTSEIPLPDQFERFKLKLSPEKFHDLLAFASLYIGEGAKTASEAGVLGIPWVYISNSRRGYLDDQERKYFLGKTVSSIEEARKVAERLLDKSEPEWRMKQKEKLLTDTIDVTQFMTNLVDNWPESMISLRSK